jgi:hypothetical protein
MSPSIQKPSYFVSHWWEESVEKFIACLEQHQSDRNLPDTLAYWICAYANDQHDIAKELGTRIQDTPFYRALHSQHVIGVMLVIDSAGEVFTRYWCIFEWYLALIVGETRQLDLYTAKGTHGRPVGLTDGLAAVDYYKGGTGSGGSNKAKREGAFPTSLLDLARTFDLRTATTSKKADEALIRAFLQGNEEALTATVRATLAARRLSRTLALGPELELESDLLKASRLRKLQVVVGGDGQQPAGGGAAIDHAAVALRLQESLPTTLEVLLFANVHPNVAVGGGLARLLREGAVRSLVLRNCGPFDDAHMQLVGAALAGASRCPSWLQFSSDAITDAGAKSLASALAAHTGLKTLDLDNNRLTAAGVRALAPVLSGMKGHQGLFFASNRLGDEGAAELAAIISQRPSLERVRVWNNGITDVGAVALAPSLASRTKLREVWIQRNALTAEGERALRAALEGTRLKVQLRLRA